MQRRETGIWIIRDTGRGDRSTGTRDRGEAEKRLAEYIAQRDRRPGGPAQPDEITVAEVLTFYATEHVASGAVKDPTRIAYAIESLLDYWGELPANAVNRETCRAYGRSRVRHRKDPKTGEVIETTPIADGTIRKELGVLSAAFNYCREEGRILNPPKVHLPDKPAPKDRWLTRSEAARLLWAAYRNPEAKHLARFMLVALYTGTRKSAILRLRFMRNVNGGHVDTEAGILYRRAPGVAETKKKTPHIRVAPRLLGHLRRWEAHGERWVVAYEGQGVASIKTAWRTAARAAKLDDATPHTLRHTAITWACQSGRADLWELSGYFGVSMETMTKVYAHHHPDHQQGAVAAIGGRKL
ncbi:Tyrosine recombinase XerC [Roseivivax jejudonensis]|uniref:Tyrosine recombinase XerC n=1 Tax=Roseivivax jejudonensis TaxID=1529041 RepID=A0A1X6YFC9_9RHOB|nr:tyrosine-type recombinase/integrase [Roseivivax jejudonensis]SLN19777.1 Tyrosine recombinase XerC [Roseivivax jejudonensis]